jgi:hypothetical protein
LGIWQIVVKRYVIRIPPQFITHKKDKAVINETKHICLKICEGNHAITYGLHTLFCVDVGTWIIVKKLFRMSSNSGNFKRNISCRPLWVNLGISKRNSSCWPLLVNHHLKQQVLIASCYQTCSNFGGTCFFYTVQLLYHDLLSHCYHNNSCDDDNNITDFLNGLLFC